MQQTAINVAAQVLNERNAKLAIVVFPFEPQLNYRHDTANYDYAVKPQRILQRNTTFPISIYIRAPALRMTRVKSSIATAFI
jgi:hypothetical protein